MTYCPKLRWRLRKYEGTLLGIGYLQIKSYTNGPFRGHTCSVCLLRQKSQSWKNYMRAFVEAIQEEGLYHVEPSHKDIGGQKCGRKRRSTLGNAISVKGMLQISINREEFLILSLALGPLPNGGLDIVGPFPKAIGNKKYLLVGTDYFTKWVEAEPLANIRDVDVKKFIWRNIVTRFGIPHTLVSDNGLQFDSDAFREYCSELGIRNRYSTPAYPQRAG